MLITCDEYSFCQTNALDSFIVHLLFPLLGVPIQIPELEAAAVEAAVEVVLPVRYQAQDEAVAKKATELRFTVTPDLPGLWQDRNLWKAALFSTMYSP